MFCKQFKVYSWGFVSITSVCFAACRYCFSFYLTRRTSRTVNMIIDECFRSCSLLLSKAKYFSERAINYNPNNSLNDDLIVCFCPDQMYQIFAWIWNCYPTTTQTWFHVSAWEKCVNVNKYRLSSQKYLFNYSKVSLLSVNNRLSSSIVYKQSFNFVCTLHRIVYFFISPQFTHQSKRSIKHYRNA